MLSIPHYIQKEASTVYGDMVEKTAFDVSVNPANLVGSVVGGYAANRVYNNEVDKREQAHEEQKRLENDYYNQVDSVMKDLRIVFTPINVIFKVNDQVFEIIKTDEMTPHMKRAFQQKDGDYFRNLLVKKMGMEMQLAEQAFAKRMLHNQNPQLKQASYLTQQEALAGTDEETFEMIKEASTKGMDNIGPLHVRPDFDSLRPFDNSKIFFDDKAFTKVAGIFDYFKREQENDFDAKDLRDQVQIGFLPDRVIFLHQGQLLEQMSLMEMNEDGYEAFRKGDKNFFRNFFYTNLQEEEKMIQQPEFGNPTEPVEPSVPAKEASDQEEALEKSADEEDEETEGEDEVSLEDVLEDRSISAAIRDDVRIFEHADIHPLVYDKVLKDQYRQKWFTYEFEALLKQIEIDFGLEDKGIADMPMDKIGMLQALSGEDQSIFLSSFTFEKFLRIMNDKPPEFQAFVGGLEFGEIMFGLDIAQSMNYEDVYWEFHYRLSEYVAEELYMEDVRYVSSVLYDDDNEAERDFFQDVNGHLVRKWKEEDTKGIQEPEFRTTRKRMTETINHITDEILTKYADELDFEDIARSATAIIEKEKLIDTDREEKYEQILQSVIGTVSRNMTAGLYVEVRREELKMLIDKIDTEGVR